jgi:hypothetical protein
MKTPTGGETLRNLYLAVLGTSRIRLLVKVLLRPFWKCPRVLKILWADVEITKETLWTHFPACLQMILLAV